MKFIRSILLAGVSLPALASNAFADPVSIGSFVISSLLGVGAGGILPAVSAAAIGNFVIGAAAIGLSVARSFMGSTPKIDPGDFKSTFETGESSEVRAVGRVRVGGLKAFGNTASGSDRYRLICHTRGKVTAVEQHFFGGREITVEPDGAISSPPWAKPGGSWAYVKAKIGDGTETAWADLMSAFPALWTVDHRVRGIAQSLIRYISPGLTEEKFMKLYQSGVPDYERVQRSEPVYDPRTGQSPTNEATWAYSDNGPLCAAHILRSYPSLTVGDFDYSGIATEGTKADAIVATLTGTEKRSRCWGLWTSETARGDVMEQVLKSIGAEIVPADDNTFVVRLVDDVRTPEITFTEKHLVDLQWRSGPESVERPNICRVTYYSPERNYEMAEIDLTGIAWARVQDEIDRVGEQIMDIDLPFCPSASQAQRIARRLFALARADAGVATFNFAGLAAWGKTIAAIPLPDLDIVETCAIGVPRVNDQEGTVEIPFVVWPKLDPWNPATMEAAAPDPIPEMQYESELDKPAAPSAAAVVRYPDSSYETRVKFAAVAGGTIAEAVYRTYTAGEPNAYTSMTEYSGTGTNQYAYDAADSRGSQADFKCRFFNDDDEGSYYSDLLSVAPMAIDNTPTGAPSVSVESDPGGRVFKVAVPEINAVRITVEARTDAEPTWVLKGSADEARPGVEYTLGPVAFPNPSPLSLTYYWRVASLTSDGTVGTYATGFIVVDGAGGGHG
ncbi:MAG: phage tail protein [Mesorhizobium sp.]